MTSLTILHPLTSFPSLHPILSTLTLTLLLLVIFRHRVRRLLTPMGIPGIPARQDPKPFYGDIIEVGRIVKESGRFSEVFETWARTLGPVSQIRLSWMAT